MVDLCLVLLPNPQLSNPKMYYNLGGLYLASVVEKAGYSANVFDMRDGYKPLPQATYYGFSATTPEIGYAKKFAQMVEGKTIVGGAHASLLPQDCLGYFDYVVVGEGEEVILDILTGHYPYSIATGRRIDDLDKIPFPAWDKIEDPFSEALFPGEKYGKGERAATLISSRGCPYMCAFCANIYFKPVRHRSVENIISELKELQGKGINHFRFEDDNIAIHPHFPELASSLASLNIHYKCHIRANFVTAEKAYLLKKSGCEECGIGVESADDVVLRLNNKKTTGSMNARAITILKEAGLRAKAYWVMGLPGETDETLKLNKEFTQDVKPDKWTVSTFTPYPGCDIYKDPVKYGIKIVDTDFNHWWNFCEGTNRYNHLILGQTMEQMWQRYINFYGFLKEGKWQVKMKSNTIHQASLVN